MGTSQLEPFLVWGGPVGGSKSAAILTTDMGKEDCVPAGGCPWLDCIIQDGSAQET